MNDTVTTILKNLFIIGGYVLFWISRYCKTKRWMMLFNSFSSMSFCIGYVLFGAYTAAAASTIVILRGFAVNFKDKKQIQGHGLFIIFVIMAGISSYLTWTGWNCLLVITVVLLNLITVWYEKNEQHLRIWALVASALYLIYQITIQNFVGAVLEGTVIISCLTSWYKYHKTKCKEKLTVV